MSAAARRLLQVSQMNKPQLLPLAFTRKCRRHQTSLWATVARKLAETGRYGASGLECNEKWCNLHGTYKRNKDKKGSSRHKAVMWEYFDLMDEVLGSTASTQPSAITQLFSSLPSLITPPPESFRPSLPGASSDTARVVAHGHVLIIIFYLHQGG